MNLRILKKLSKRAAPLLVQIGDRREVFAGDDEWPGSVDVPVEVRPDERQPYDPLKGTLMVGSMSGGEQPEWSDETCWHALCENVYWHFTEYNPEFETLDPTRRIQTPSDVFRAAREMISALAVA